MSFLNTPIPIIDAYIRGNFLRDQTDSFDKKFPCLIFGMCSIPSQAPLFHFMMEDGGLWWRMPIHAFCWKEDAVQQELDELVLWDSFSYHVGATQYPYLKNKVIKFTSRRRVQYDGRYLFTLDWAASTDSGDTDYLFSEYPSQHKCGHVIAMENGNFAIQPNNRLTVHDPSFTVKSEPVINRMYNNTIWTAERNKRWVTPDTNNMQYDHTDLDKGESNERRSIEYDEQLKDDVKMKYDPCSVIKLPAKTRIYGTDLLVNPTRITEDITVKVRNAVECQMSSSYYQISVDEIMDLNDNTLYRGYSAFTGSFEPLKIQFPNGWE